MGQVEWQNPISSVVRGHLEPVDNHLTLVRAVRLQVLDSASELLLGSSERKLSNRIFTNIQTLYFEFECRGNDQKLVHLLLLYHLTPFCKIQFQSPHTKSQWQQLHYN